MTVMIRSRPMELPTAGMFCPEKRPIRLSYLPPPVRLPTRGETTVVSKMGPV